MSGAEALERRSEAKTFSDMAARFACNGWAFWRSDADDGPVRYFAARWGQVKVMADLAEAEAFLERATGKRGQ